MHVLEPVWPKSKNITKHDCFNMRVRVNRLMPIYKSTDGNYTDFQEVVNANDLLDGIDNAPTLDDDEAYALAQSLWLEVMSTMNDEEDMISLSLIISNSSRLGLKVLFTDLLVRKMIRVVSEVEKNFLVSFGKRQQ